MSTYINKITNEYPLYEGDIRLAHPEISEEFILPEEFAVVIESQLPELQENEIFYEMPPVLNNDGNYEKVYETRMLTEEEMAQKAEMRKEYEK